MLPSAGGVTGARVVSLSAQPSPLAVSVSRGPSAKVSVRVAPRTV